MRGSRWGTLERAHLARTRNNPLPYFARLTAELPARYIDKAVSLNLNATTDAVSAAEAKELLARVFSHHALTLSTQRELRRMLEPHEGAAEPWRSPSRRSGASWRIAWSLSTPLDPFLDLRALASYASLSVRKLRDLLDDPLHPLPAYQVGGRLLVRRSEFDTWMAAHRRRSRVDVDAIVSDVLNGRWLAVASTLQTPWPRPSLR
jgi:hypothetical protein